MQQSSLLDTALTRQVTVSARLRLHRAKVSALSSRASSRLGAAIGDASHAEKSPASAPIFLLGFSFLKILRAKSSTSCLTHQIEITSKLNSDRRHKGGELRKSISRALEIQCILEGHEELGCKRLFIPVL